MQAIVLLAEDGNGIDFKERTGFRHMVETARGVLIEERDTDGSNTITYMIPWGRVVRVVYG